jgi:hypothetical protein
MLSFLIISLWVTPLMAETYSWTDQSGTINFTEDYSSVPRKYRKKVQKRGNIGGQPVQTVSKEDSSGKTNSNLQQTPNQEVKAVSTDDDLYDGKNAGFWQQDFQRRGAELKRLEQQLVQLESLIRKPVGISKERTNALPQEFKTTQKQYSEALKSYNDLNDAANKAGLPAEYRK